MTTLAAFVITLLSLACLILVSTCRPNKMLCVESLKARLYIAKGFEVNNAGEVHCCRAWKRLDVPILAGLFEPLQLPGFAGVGDLQNPRLPRPLPAQAVNMLTRI